MNGKKNLKNTIAKHINQNKMKANELRTGNYVMYSSLIQVNDYKIDECEEHPTRFGPIQLTEEWLLKFGFTEKYKSIHNSWTKNGSKIFQLSDYEDEEGELMNEFYYEGNVHVKYVHQLQNLYFALTEKELTFKSE